MPLSNAQYDEIMRSYQEKQLARHHLITSREQELEQIAPRMAQLNAEIAHRSVQEAKSRLGTASSGSDDAESVREQIMDLAKEKRQILTSLGYPEDYLDPPYECPDCKDTGYIGSERCHCFKQAAIDLIYGQSNLAAVFERENFDHFSLDYYPRDLIEKETGVSAYAAAENTYHKCLQFVRDFDNTYQNLFLFGNTGVGKTFLCNCIAGELIHSGHSVIYFSADRLFDTLADHAFGRRPGAESDYHNILDCDLLIIDDLGTEMTNSFTLSQFFVCLNERILHEKSTLISSNLGLLDISSIYSERIFSRITSNFMLLHLFGKDIRVQKNL